MGDLGNSSHAAGGTEAVPSVLKVDMKTYDGCSSVEQDIFLVRY